MWTPRRVVLLLGGILAFGGVYGVYARFLGWLDGLPQLPARMRETTSGRGAPPERVTSPTIELLRLAFGPDCPEQQSGNYPTQLHFPNGESSVVLAAGPTPLAPGTNRVTLAPFSLAVIGKLRPPGQRAPGEVQEISTFHADKAVLEFDRPINGPNDKPNLLRLELISEPEHALPDKRRGTVHVTNNQRSADPNNFLVLRTPGPVFYRDPKNVVPQPAAGPDVWTDAAVEITDRQNLPRGYGAPAPPTAPAAGVDLRAKGAVPEILAGHRLPPPTVSAVGLRVYLEDAKAKADAKPGPDGAPPKKGSAGFSGVRRVELLGKVLFNLWVDARQGFVTAAEKDAPDKPAGEKPLAAGSPLGMVDPPPAVAAVTGGTFFAVQSARRLDRALLQVDTLGPFSYDATRNIALFDVVPQADPNLPNDVQVHRIPPQGGTQRLFSQMLEIEFNGPPTGADAGKPAPTPDATKPAPPPKEKDKSAGSNAPGFKRLHAWTYTPGRYLTVSSDADRLEAFGLDLVHEQAESRTTLKGAPLYVVRSNEPRADGKPAGDNVLNAGSPQQPATLVLQPGPGKDATTTATVHGFGRLELFDPNSGKNTIHAVWKTSLVQTKITREKPAASDPPRGPDLDLFTFTGDAEFRDTRPDEKKPADKQPGYWLKGDVLQLWMETGKKADGAKAATGTQQLPYRLQADGRVTGHSADYDIEAADHLTVMFREGAAPMPSPKYNPVALDTPPAAAAPAADAKAPPARSSQPAPAASSPDAKATVPGSPAAPAAPAPPEPKAKPPMKIRARDIKTWVVRFPVLGGTTRMAGTGPKMPGLSPADPGLIPGEGSTKYQLERADCEGSMPVNGVPAPLVHQDPTDPEKPRGVDVFGSKLHLDHTADGSVMTVTGTDDRLGEVHHEGVSIIGPTVTIDQLLNRVTVVGRGSLVMPAGSGLNGGDAKPAPGPAGGPAAAPEKPPAEVVVHWRDEMKFYGAAKSAEFIGRVRASQADSFVTCHTMQVVLDRPLYFNQMQKPAAAPPARDPRTGKAEKTDPKIEVVYCYPAPEDARDEPKGANVVVYSETSRDDGGRVIKTQHLTARELVMTARATDETGREPFQQVVGEGPGVVRIWQMGEKDATRTTPGAPAAGTPAPPAPTAAQPPKETEMKLTVVQFSGRMRVKDKKIYQEAVFQSDQGGTIDVIHAPANDPAAQLDRHHLPQGAVQLRCSERLIVSSTKQEKNPPAQRLDATGNAFIQSDEYQGWGENITSDGRFVTLTGNGNTLARIYHRFNRTENPGRKITYDRATGGFQVDGSAGTIFQNTSPGKK